MLVDTGPDETYQALRRRLLVLPLEAGGRRHIDLFVVSHIDHDHIDGAALGLKDADLKVDFGDAGSTRRPQRHPPAASPGASRWR